MNTFTLYANIHELPTGTQRLKVIGGGSCMIEFHLNLPEIDEDRKGTRYVFWCGPETGQQLYGADGTGDDQVWVLYPHSDKYVPLQRPTIAREIP